MAKLGFAWGLPLLAMLLGSVFSFSQAAASPEAVEWSAVNIPAEGKSGNWALAAGSNVKHLTMAKDGTLYVYANPTGTNYTLFKSTDGGYGWSYTGQVQDNIVSLATASDDASTIAYATTSKVYKSTDAATSFVSLPANPGGAGSNNIEITCIAIAYVGYHIIAIGTRDTDGWEFGGVYIFDESKSFTWTNTNIGNYDVYGLAFSPNFAADGQLVAVVTDEINTFVTTRIGDGGWGQILGNAQLNKDNTAIPSSVAVDTSAALAFPDGYNPASVGQAVLVGIDAGAENGDVYRINWAVAPGNSSATDLNIGATYGLNNVDVTSLAIIGSSSTANILAGTAGSAQVYFSTNGGTNWSRSTKPPTGQSKTYVLGTPNLSQMYAATSGTQSAFSYSADGGVLWNQLALRNTTITNILDLAISPGYNDDNTLFMLTFGSGEHSLWRSFEGGGRWETVFLKHTG